jgi:hypothetical protein
MDKLLAEKEVLDEKTVALVVDVAMLDHSP